MKSLTLTSLLILTGCLAACDKGGGAEHGKIQKGGRSGGGGFVEGKSKDCKVYGRAEKDKDNLCLNLMAVVDCMRASDNVVARISTSDVSALEANSDFTAAKSAGDSKLVAQLMNEGGDIKMLYQLGRLKDLRLNPELIDVVGQNKCESVTLKDGAGNIQQYKIVSTKKSAKLTLKSEKDGAVKVISFAPGRLSVRNIRALSGEVKRCGESRNLLISNDVELAYGSAGNRGQIQVSTELAKLMANNTDASESLKQVVNALVKNEKPVKNRNTWEKVSSRTSVNEFVYVEAVSHMKKGQFKNLECGDSKPRPDSESNPQSERPVVIPPAKDDKTV